MSDLRHESLRDVLNCHTKRRIFVQAYGGTAEWESAEVFEEPAAADEQEKDGDPEEAEAEAEVEEKRLDPSDGLPYTKASFIEVSLRVWIDPIISTHIIVSLTAKTLLMAIPPSSIVQR